MTSAVTCRPLKDPPCFTATVRHRLAMGGFYPVAPTSKSCNRTPVLDWWHAAIGFEPAPRTPLPPRRAVGRLYPGPPTAKSCNRTPVLDWWHAAMRFEHALRTARGLGAG